MSTGAKILLWLHLLAALGFLLSVLYDLTKRLARKAFGIWSETLDRAAQEIR